MALVVRTYWRSSKHLFLLAPLPPLAQVVSPSSPPLSFLLSFPRSPQALHIVFYGLLPSVSLSRPNLCASQEHSTLVSMNPFFFAPNFSFRVHFPDQSYNTRVDTRRNLSSLCSSEPPLTPALSLVPSFSYVTADLWVRTSEFSPSEYHSQLPQLPIRSHRRA